MFRGAVNACVPLATNSQAACTIREGVSGTSLEAVFHLAGPSRDGALTIFIKGYSGGGTYGLSPGEEPTRARSRPTSKVALDSATVSWHSIAGSIQIFSSRPSPWGLVTAALDPEAPTTPSPSRLSLSGLWRCP